MASWFYEILGNILIQKEFIDYLCKYLIKLMKQIIFVVF
jgi:hypothetical protein